MRILHTSDWHIGRTFHGHSTLDALRGVLDALVAQVRANDVDVVIVAGDVFDSATPAAGCYALLSDTLAACRKEEELRIARETRDPEKEKEMHKMDAYIRRKDVSASPKRLATMQQYRAKLAEMGADADSLAAYNVFISAVAAEVEKQEQGKDKK